MSHPPLPRQELELFLIEQLGPACVERFRDPLLQQELAKLLADGMELDDAVLKLVHGLSADDRNLADEFFGHFLSALMRIGHFTVSDGLRRFVETGDLVNSVAGSLWRDFAQTEFHTRRQYLTYCGQRLQWKAADRARSMSTAKRREDRHRSLELEDVEPMSSAGQNKPGPATEVGNREEWDRLAVAMLRLPDRDRMVLQIHLRGGGNADVAEQLSLSPEAARKALQRAIEKARALI